MTAPSFQCAVLTRYLLYTLKIKIFCYSAKSYIRISKFIKYNSDCFSFRFFYQELIDEYIFPDKEVKKSSVRRRLDAELDKLNDKELSVIEATVIGLCKAKEPED